MESRSRVTTAKTAQQRRYRFVSLMLALSMCAVISACNRAGGPRGRALVIIVHGTWAGESEWPKDDRGKASFGSEVLRGLDGEGEIYPFLWESSIFHEKRKEATERLVKVIDEKGPAFDRVCLVGHSHGGNIAMLAAGQSRQPIDMVVCLSTPHVYLCAIGENERKLYLPVYFSPKALANVNQVISLWPNTDTVPDDVSNMLLRGMGENEALELTRQWREQYNHPRLPRDDFLVRALQRFNEMIGVRLFESGNIVASPTLKYPNAGSDVVTNIEYHSLVVDSIRSHSAAHSRRMGYLVGRVLRGGMTDKAKRYMQTLVQPKDADQGEPISAQQHESWCSQNAPYFKRAGWLLKRINIRLLPEATKPGGFGYDARPDPFLRIRASGSSTGHRYAPFETSFERDSTKASWQPELFIYEGDSMVLKIVDHDLSTLLGNLDPTEQSLGTASLTASAPIPTAIDSSPDDDRFWSSRIVWVEGHY